MFGVQFRDLELGQSGGGLAQVQPGAGHRDGQLDAHRDRQRLARHRSGQLERLVGASQAAFAIDHHGQLVVFAGDTPVGAQFP